MGRLAGEWVGRFFTVKDFIYFLNFEICECIVYSGTLIMEYSKKIKYYDTKKILKSILLLSLIEKLPS